MRSHDSRGTSPDEDRRLHQTRFRRPRRKPRSAPDGKSLDPAGWRVHGFFLRRDRRRGGAQDEEKLGGDLTILHVSARRKREGMCASFLARARQRVISRSLIRAPSIRERRQGSRDRSRPSHRICSSDASHGPRQRGRWDRLLATTGWSCVSEAVALDLSPGKGGRAKREPSTASKPSSSLFPPSSRAQGPQRAASRELERIMAVKTKPIAEETVEIGGQPVSGDEGRASARAQAGRIVGEGVGRFRRSSTRCATKHAVI